MIITSQHDLVEFCRGLAQVPVIAFDTEFVSEHSYRPQLCLVQVAAGDRLVVIDPLAVADMRPFWEALAAPGHETIVHAGREELLFCLEAVAQPPRALFDVQLAAGLVGLDYPSGYGSLIYRLLGLTPRKGETRTDWRRRPLTERQIDYALDDVRHLAELRLRLGRRLEELRRTGWFADEMSQFESEVTVSRGRERWRKVSGSANLPARSQAIVRELWLWREQEAQRRDWPVRRVLRDDLIVELAKRRSADAKQIRAVRGLERGDLQRAVPALSAAIAKGLELPEAACPQAPRRESSPQLNMLGQFLSSALSSICRDAQVASSLVGTATDVRDLIEHQLGQRGADQEVPSLARGWRAEVVGHLLDDLLAGKVSIRIKDPNSEQPLAFERTRR
ncbi:MAG: HRDC domain-containing protein [Pirellulales bacterium]